MNMLKAALKTVTCCWLGVAGVCSSAHAAGLLVGQAVIPVTSSSITVVFSTPPDSAIPPADAVVFDEVPVVVGTSDGRQQSLGLLLPDEAADIRISNVTTSGFTASYQRKRDTLFGTVTEVTEPAVPITFHYIAASPGVTELPGGLVMEAGSLSNVAFNSPQLVNFQNVNAAPPALFVGFQTLNNPTEWVVANGYGIAQQQATLVMANRTGNAPANSEDIGYIAFNEGTTKFVASDGLATGIQVLREQTGITGPSGGYPGDCGSVVLNDTYLVALGNQATVNQAGGVVRRCTGAQSDEAYFYIDTEEVAGNRNTANELVSVIAFTRPFYSFFGIVADYQLDQCLMSGTSVAIADNGPYGLNGVGDALARESVIGLLAPAPQCGAAGFTFGGVVPSGIAVGDDPRFDIQGSISIAAWFNHRGTQTQTGFPELQTIAGKGGDAYRLSIEKVCTVDNGGVRVIDEASTTGTGVNLCDVAGGTGLASSEVHFVVRLEVTNQGTGVPTFIRSTQIGANQANVFFDPSGTVSPDVWQHVRVTFDGFSLKLVLDSNALAETASSSAIPLNVNDEPFTLGLTSVAGVSSSLFDGLLDEVTLWENALSMETLDEIHRQRVRGCQSCGRETIYWRESYFR